MKTVGSLLSSNSPLNTIHLKVNKGTGDFSSNSSSSSCIQIDDNKRIITLLDPTPSRRRRGIGGVVRNYKFDNIVTQDTLKVCYCFSIEKNIYCVLTLYVMYFLCTFRIHLDKV